MSIIVSGEGTSQAQEDVEQGKRRTEEEFKLYKAALEGDWDTAQAIYNSDPNKFNEGITNRGETALHMAALAGHTHFVKKLVKLMSDDGLAHKAKDGQTAFYYAVMTGKKELANAIMNEKEGLKIPLVCEGGKSFLKWAAVFGHRDMVELVYQYNKDILSDEDRKDLLVLLIGADMYDIAWDMLKEHPNVAAAGLERVDVTKTPKSTNARLDVNKTPEGTKAADNNPESSKDTDENPNDGTNATAVEYIKKVKRTTMVRHTSATTMEYSAHVEGTKTLIGTKTGEDTNAAKKEKPKTTPLQALARKRYRIRKGAHQEHEQDLTDNQKAAEKILRCIWKEMMLKDRGSPLDDFHFKPIFLAAEQGNVEFLTILVDDYPDILFIKDENGRTIIHVAVLNRHKKIFKFIHKFGDVKNLITMYKDMEGNNMLHLAGKLAPPRRLGVLPGAALQLQQEMMWFEVPLQAVINNLIIGCLLSG